MINATPAITTIKKVAPHDWSASPNPVMIRKVPVYGGRLTNRYMALTLPAEVTHF